MKSLAALLLSTGLALLAGTPASAQAVAWSLGEDPTTLDPARVDDHPSEAVRYLTGGVLLRINRHTQQVEPSLADRWTLSPDGRTVTLHLRPGLLFSDGTPLTATDAAWSLRRVLARETGAPVAEEFLQPAKVRVDTPDAATVRLQLQVPVVSVERIFDEIAIEPANRASQARVTSGPYTVAEYRRGQFLRLERNPHYWRRDAAGGALPYIASIRLDVIASPEQAQMRFLRGEYAVLDSPSPDYFNALARSAPAAAHDLGPSLNTEQLWFNQSPAAPLPAWEKQWFASTAFRVAVSESIHRADLARLAYGGRASAADSFVSPANKLWRNTLLRAPHEDAAAAQALLAKEGFHRAAPGAPLLDREGHPVRFSLVTNAGNGARARMATLIQEDLRALGMEVRVVTMDFPALIDRLLHSQDYEACLLGLANVDPDPNAMMNVWLSSSPNHQWNPSEKTPATPWEAELDRQMEAQASARSYPERKRAVDRVQQIVAEQQPFIYLVYPHALLGVSPLLTGTDLAVLDPGAVWNIDTLRWKGKP